MHYLEKYANTETSAWYHYVVDKLYSNMYCMKHIDNPSDILPIC